jgi:hypothetical protein
MCLYRKTEPKECRRPNNRRQSFRLYDGLLLEDVEACPGGYKFREAADTAAALTRIEMGGGTSRVLLITAIIAAGSFSVRAEERTIADLLTRAEAQAAAGHRWAPPGDNMTETVAVMMDIIAQATPEQLVELSNLLEKNSSNPPSPSSAQATPVPITPAQATPAQATPAQATPARASTPAGAPAQTPPAQAFAAPLPIQIAPSETAPAQTAPTRAIPNPAPPPARAAAPATAAQAGLTPDRRTVTVETTAPERPAPIRVMPRPTPRALELYARGQDAERQGNISGARRFFAGAAEQGSAAAARSLGQLYDPAYLKQTVFGGIDPDPALARNWYQRAAAMGDAEAGPLLEALAVR